MERHVTWKMIYLCTRGKIKIDLSKLGIVCSETNKVLLTTRNT